MNLTIRTHHAALAPGFEEHAEKKLDRLQRLLPRLGDITIEVEHEETRAAAHRYSVQITARAGGAILRAEERAADPAVALDAAAEVLSRQARRHKKRLDDRHHPRPADGAAAKAIVAERLNTSAGTPEPRDDDEADEYLLGKIVRVKRFEAKPMPPEEALAQMDLLGHDFFLFLDATTGDYALLYKRVEGDYGMLAPRRG